MSFDINWLAAIAAAVAGFLVGAVWYSPILFSTIWQREVKLSDAQIRSGNLGATFGMAFVLTLVAAILLAALLGPKPTLGDAVLTSAVVGVGLVATSFGISYLFERRSLTIWLINAGYHVAQFVAMGLVLGLWP